MTSDHAPAEPSDCADCSEGPQLPQYVRLSTGEFFWQQEDIRIAGRGIDFAWTRTYRSRPERGTPHWDHAYNLTVRASRGGFVVANGAGATDLYRAHPGGGYVARGIFAEARFDARNQFRIRFSGGGAWEFRSLDDSAAAGCIDKIVDRNGNTLHFGYGASGRLVLITDTLGRDIRIGYDPAGRIATLTDFTGRQVSYRHSDDGDLTAVIYPAVTGTPTGNDFPNGATLTYAYSAPHRLAAITDRAGEPLLDIQYAEAFDHERVSALRWGRSGNPTHFTYHPTDEGSAAVAVIVNDGNGNVRDLLFDKLNACVGTRVYTARADAAKPVTPNDNRPTQLVRRGEPPFYETQYSYANPDGLLTRIVRPDGSTVDKQFEIDLSPDAAPMERGNLRVVRHTPGPGGGATPELVRHYAYLPGFGCTCGQACVTRQIDPHGAAWTTQYDDRGNPTVLIDRDGSRTELAYNSFGDVVARTSPGGGRTDTFEYSVRHGQLITETLDAGGLATTTAYTYDELGRPVVVRDPSGGRHTHVWNAWDLLVRRELPHDNRIGASTEDLRYDANGRTVGRVVKEAGREVVEAKTYDVRGRLRTASRESEPGRQIVIAFSYDDNGNRNLVRRGAADVVRLTYDTLDRPLQRFRGERGNGLREATFGYDAVGNLTRVTRGSGAEASTSVTRFDGYGRATSYVAPNGLTVHFSHDPNGNVLHQKITGTEGELIAEVEQTYDVMDRLTQRTSGGPGVTDPAVESWEFDTSGRLAHRVEPTGQSWRTRYDALDRPIEIADGTGAVTAYTYDRNSNVVEESTQDGAVNTRLRYARDPSGRILEVTDGQGLSHTYAYDVHDRPGSIGLPRDRRIALDYDGLGRPTMAQFAGLDDADTIEISQIWDDHFRMVARTDPNGNVTRYRHDAAGDIVQLQHPDGTSELYSYDSRGNCTRWTDPNGTIVINTYDVMDKLVRRAIAPGTGVAADTTTESYGYDAVGRLTMAKNDRHTSQWRYDALGRPVAQAQDSKRVTTEYDARGRRTSVGYPSGYRLELDYEGAELRRIRDARGAAVEIEHVGALRFSRTRGPVRSTVERNIVGLPERLVTAAGQRILDERRYHWDESANVIGIEITDPRGRREISYTVDGLDRLRASANDGRLIEYELDAAGNRTVVHTDGEKGRYLLDGGRAANQYTATPADRRTYDANGNLLSITDSHGNRRTMRYDYRNRMVEFRDGTTCTRYSYDCLGRRLTKSMHNRTEVRYAYDGEALIEEESGSATKALVRNGRSIYGIVGDEPEDDRWFVTDAMASVVAEFDESGAITRSYVYGDFGQPAAADGTPPVSFAGYTFDEESGLYYARSRYLEPATGRFTTRDPAGVWEDGRNRGNAYSYAGNNPATFVDPTGQSTIRLHSCGGPWPGPRFIKVEYEGCSKGRRDAMKAPVCRAFRASGQSSERVFNLWLNDYTGIAQPGAGTTRSQVKFWFGGPDNATSLNSKGEIFSTLRDVYDAITGDDFDVDCESGGACDSAAAYVNWNGEDVNVCSGFFNNGYSASMQAGVLIHELTHAYNSTSDYFYYLNEEFDNQPYNSQFETPTLRENADNYRMFTMNFFLP